MNLTVKGSAKNKMIDFVADIKKRDVYVLFAGFLFSLVIKFCLLQNPGNLDMFVYHEWGVRVLKKGLADSYEGTYFPLQWCLFAFYSLISLGFNISWIVIFKLANLFFDIGVFLTLVLLLRKYKLSPLYALLYCLQPWFIIIFSQGFVDSQFTFFVLLPLLLLKDQNNDIKSYMISGVPLACAFLMKPQVMFLVAVIFIYSIWGWFRRKGLTSAAIFIPLVLLFGYFFLFFAIFRQESLAKTANIIIPGFLYLPVSYLEIGSIMPCLTASMDNIWYIPACLLRRTGVPIYSINIPQATLLSAFCILISIIIFTYKLAKKYEYSLNSKSLFFMFAFTVFIVPFFMTSAHCNHPFPASVFMIVLCAMLYNKKVLFFIFNLLFLAMGVSIVSRYGWGHGQPLGGISHTDTLSCFIGILSTVLVVYILYFLVKEALRRQADIEPVKESKCTLERDR